MLYYQLQAWDPFDLSTRELTPAQWLQEIYIPLAKYFSIFSFFKDETNDDLTRRNIFWPIKRLIESEIINQTLSDARVVVDTTNNPPSLIDDKNIKTEVFFKNTQSPIYYKLIMYRYKPEYTNA